MIKISLCYRRGRLEGLLVEGHAGYGAYGEDVVCAAVSALAQTAVLALERLAGVKPRARVERGYLECLLPGGLTAETRKQAGLVLETVALGLAEVERAYPRYVSLKRHEINGKSAGTGSRR